ncbi:MAG: DUF1592 domain-containing protein [Rubripirellula sp.]
MQVSRRIGIVIFAGLLWPVGVVADEVKQTLKPFFVRYCNDCHAEGAQEGGLSLDTLGFDLDDPATFAKWERVFDRVEHGEMPPEDAEQITDAHRSSFIKLLGRPLFRAHANSKGTVLRRLNRREYQNTLNDLFGTDLDLESTLPKDGRSHEFDNVGESLSISMVQLQLYLNAIDRVMDVAIAKTVERPRAATIKANYADTREGEKHIGTAWKKLDDGAVVFFRPLGYPTGMLRTASAPEAGRYRIRVTGYAYQSDTPITFAIGATTFQRGAEKPTFGYRALPPGKPTTIEIEGRMDRRFMVELTPWGIADENYEIKKHGIDQYTGAGLAILGVELEGPLVDEFPSRGHQLIFDGLNRREIEPSSPAQKMKSWYVPKFEVRSDQPIQQGANVLQRVATAAFRRPVNAAEIERYMDLLGQQMEDGESFESALRTSVAAIFCSPDFLFLQEPAGLLDDHAIASRLSYFLTRTTPDAELLASAKAGRLTNDPTQLSGHTRRLLQDPRAERFVIDFTDAWLNLRDIEFTSPDKSLYPEFDPFLKFSMLQETREFFARLVRSNLPVSDLIQPDFAMLNNRLAKHYGIEGVSSPQVQRVGLPAGSVRGGILGQASVLKVSANGTNTSPVMRGVWVTERIIGQHPPPPPPGISGVEPDIRGASTLRELLAKHRELDSCQPCHQMIDPPGFALESFDPIGGWRDRFRSLGEGEKVTLEIAGRKVRYRLGPEVDASGELADGRKFDGFKQFRDLLASDEDLIARTLATKLLTFATGREMGFSDRSAIDAIVKKSKAKGHGVRDLIELVVASELFRRK